MATSPKASTVSPVPTRGVDRELNEVEDKPTELAFGQRWEGAGRQKRPSLAGPGSGGNASDGRRKSSVQFNTTPAEETIRRESAVQVPRLSTVNRRDSRRMSSPPPTPTYKRGVSFDTFDNKDATDYSFTLNYKHKDYKHSRRSRTFLCGADKNDYSEFALEWLLDELVDDGDEIVCLRVVEKDSKAASESSIEAGKYKEQAKKLLESVIAKNTTEDKAISLVMELAVGKVEKVIQRMIQIYEPAVLIVGTRGRNLAGMQGLLPGSVSKYCLQQSPIPVIVVRSSAKRQRKKKKRQLDPNRSLYGSMLYQAQQGGGSHALDKSCTNSVMTSLPEATEQEAAAVAQAIGVPKNYRRFGGPLARVTSTRSDSGSGGDSAPSGEGFLPAGIFRAIGPVRADTALKSPQMMALTDDVWDSDEDDNKTETNGERDESREQSPEERSGMLGPAKTVDQRRPSVRETNPWLDQILKSGDNERRLSPGPGRGHSRSRSR